jgi:hypothetical protein
VRADVVFYCINVMCVLGFVMAKVNLHSSFLLAIRFFCQFVSVRFSHVFEI